MKRAGIIILSFFTILSSLVILRVGIESLPYRLRGDRFSISGSWNCDTYFLCNATILSGLIFITIAIFLMSGKRYFRGWRIAPIASGLFALTFAAYNSYLILRDLAEGYHFGLEYSILASTNLIFLFALFIFFRRVVTYREFKSALAIAAKALPYLTVIYILVVLF